MTQMLRSGTELRITISATSPGSANSTSAVREIRLSTNPGK